MPYDTIRLLAHVYKKAAKEELKNNSELLESFWSKCKEIAGSINIAESKYNKLSSLEKVQYFYNAYIVESYLQNTLGLHYSTSSDDHNILHTSKVKSASKADFDNLNILGANKFSVEIKCYGNTQDAKEYLDGEDRSYFYDADFILVYIMYGGFWWLRLNKIGAADRIPHALDKKLPGLLHFIEDKNFPGGVRIEPWTY